MTELSHSPKGMPDRRAASLAVSRASGRMPLTLHGTPNFILHPTSRWRRKEACVLDSLTAGRTGYRPPGDFLPLTVNTGLTTCRSAGVSVRIGLARRADRDLLFSFRRL